MSQYEIKFNKENGWSYKEGDIPVESANVELSDEEVQILVDLMSQHNSYNVSDLNLEDSYPDIFTKLTEACDSIAWDIALAEEIRDIHYYDENDAFLDKLQEYCESEYDYDESLGDFRHWLSLLVQSWPCDKLRELYNNADIDLFWDIINFWGIEPYEHDVIIPQSIVAKVFEK